MSWYPTEPLSEARFIHPTEECQHPDYWTSTDGDSTEVEVSDVAWGLVRGLQPDFCLETGSGWGQTAARIDAALQANGHGKLVTLEVDSDRCRATLERTGAYTEVVQSESLSWTPPTGVVIDFAWFDSWYELRVPEFLYYRTWMRAGTVVCFHDTAPEHGSHRIASGRDLRSEITEELGEMLDLVHFPTPRGLTIGVCR